MHIFDFNNGFKFDRDDFFNQEIYPACADLLIPVKSWQTNSRLKLNLK